MRTGIYIIKNTETEMFYIGASLDYYRRISFHKSMLRNNKHTNKELQNDWNQYGKEKFIFRFIEDCVECDLRIRERYHIEANRGKIYNKNSRSPIGIDWEENLTKRKLGQRNRKNIKGYYKRSDGKYQAQIRIYGKKVNLGRFDTEEEAAAAYQEAKNLYH